MTSPLTRDCLQNETLYRQREKAFQLRRVLYNVKCETVLLIAKIENSVTSDASKLVTNAMEIIAVVV